MNQEEGVKGVGNTEAPAKKGLEFSQFSQCEELVLKSFSLLNDMKSLKFPQRSIKSVVGTYRGLMLFSKPK